MIIESLHLHDFLFVKCCLLETWKSNEELRTACFWMMFTHSILDCQIVSWTAVSESFFTFVFNVWSIQESARSIPSKIWRTGLFVLFKLGNCEVDEARLWSETSFLCAMCLLYASGWQFGVLGCQGRGRECVNDLDLFVYTFLKLFEWCYFVKVYTVREVKTFPVRIW